MDFYRPPTNQGTIDALGAVLRATRAWKFYPQGHPTRRNSLTQAHTSLLQLLDGNTLSLACSRTGFSFPDGELLKDSSSMTASLAYELFVRRVQKITFFQDLFLEDLLELIRILCVSPEEIQQSEGVDAIMSAHGVRSIWVNEFDLTAIRGKRQKVEQAGILPQGIDAVETSSETTDAFEEQPAQPDVTPPEQLLQSLLERLSTCIDEDIYLRLTHTAVSCADEIIALHEPMLLLPLVELLASHEDDDTRSQIVREGALFAIEQVISNAEVLNIVLGLVETGDGVSKTALQAVLKAGGASAIRAAVELMGRTNSLKARKTLSAMLGGLGENAVPVLIDLMRDSRWFIIRNICIILGSIASSEALTGLSECLHHPDTRVQKEAIRSLAQLGGQDAEAAILSILRGGDSALYPQVIASLAGMKSRMSLLELMKIVHSKDLFLKSLPLKIDTLAAIASIGDRQVVPHLVKLLDERHLFAAKRGKQLKAAIAACLGKLGDARSLPALKKLASDGGELGSVCSEAIAIIEKTEGK